MSNKKMWSRCVVRGCIRDPSVSMHRLPKIQAVRQQWIQKLHLDSNLNGTVFVCQLHFRESDYVGGNERKRLHCMAVPSVNLQYANIKTINTKSIESSAQEDREHLFDEETPEQNFVDKEVTGNSSINDEVMTKSVKNNDFAPDKNMHSDIVISTFYDEELLQRSVTDDLIIEVDSSCEMELITDDENQQFYEQEVASFKYHDLAARSNTISAEKSHCVCKHEAFAYHDQVTQTYPISSANKCIQVNMAYEELSRPWTLLDMLKNDSDLQSWTGIPSFSTLNNIVSCIDKLKSAQDQLKKFRSTPTMLTVFVMAKLKTDLTFKQLACLFALTPRTLGEYFHKFLPILKAVLEPVIFWPTTDQVGNNLPKCFKPDFEDCFVVMDCTETRIQRLKSLESQIKTYSHYKGGHTAKANILVTPCGLIIGVSKTYGGKASDKYIVIKETVIDKLSSGSAVMVDKGYDIRKETANKGVKLYRPPILDQPQLSTEDAMYNTKVATARIHVERAIQRIKIFNIFHGKINRSMLKHIDDIIFIACAITNLSRPILADDKF